MGNLIPPPELSLDFKPTFIPRTITQFLGEMATIGSVSEKIMKIDDLVSRLETEMRKIDAFKRELPLCMLFVNDAIVALKEELMVYKKSANQPVLEEFIPLKKLCDEDPKVETDSGDKKNWLSSTQLWNTNQNHIPKPNSVEGVIQKRTEEHQDGRIGDPYFANSVDKSILFKGYCGFSAVDTKRNDNKKEISVPEISLIAPCSLLDVESSIQIGNHQPQPHSHPPQQQTSRKQRRCWSTELHRRFVNALQQLGGSKVATPKQIRELMQVDGLTNDEVKSHLQKYRLHTKRIPSYNPSSNSPTVALGSLWNPPHPHDQYVEKRINSQSDSPDGPLLNCTTATCGTSTTGGDSMDDGDEEKSENNCWKGHLHISGKDGV